MPFLSDYDTNRNGGTGGERERAKSQLNEPKRNEFSFNIIFKSPVCRSTIFLFISSLDDYVMWPCLCTSLDPFCFCSVLFSFVGKRFRQCVGNGSSRIVFGPFIVRFSHCDEARKRGWHSSTVWRIIFEMVYRCIVIHLILLFFFLNCFDLIAIDVGPAFFQLLCVCLGMRDVARYVRFLFFLFFFHAFAVAVRPIDPSDIRYIRASPKLRNSTLLDTR